MLHKRIMNRFLNILLLVLFLFLLKTNGLAREFKLNSPNGHLRLHLNVTDRTSFSVFYDQDAILKDCSLAMVVDNTTLGRNPVVLTQKNDYVNTFITPVVPLKFAKVQNEYNSLRLKFKGDFFIEFRAFNDGVAYRFVTNLNDRIKVQSEELEINFPDIYKAHLQQPYGFKTAYEEPYTHFKTNQWEEGGRISTLPVLIETTKNYKILISESDLHDYPCMFFKGTGSNGMRAVFPKVPGEFVEEGDRSVKILKEDDCIAATDGKRNFPWRYFMVSAQDGDLVENTMTCKLAPPSQIDDPSWIKPGQVSWEWWNDASPYGPDVNFVSGYNLETYKYYIDFASRFGIPYIIMDEGWAMDTRDPYTPNPKVNVYELIRYGKEKNVGIVLWLTWLTVENHFELFKTFKDWGVAGVKIDFMDRSDQWMVNFYERVAREAARNQLFVDFHGSFKPAGLEYKYPNVLSYEGVRGMEQMGGATPDNSLYFPFMRNAVGPMDYTPGAMISMQPEVYCSMRPNSASIGTRCYQMALFIVFESGLQMLADNPTQYYKNQECTDFITQVPVTWDETRALHAMAGEYVIVAKRKGDRWFIGGITNGREQERSFEIDLDFLVGDRTCQMVAFEDGINAGRQAMDYRKTSKTVKKGETISVRLVRNGGWAAVVQ